MLHDRRVASRQLDYWHLFAIFIQLLSYNLCICLYVHSECEHFAITINILFLCVIALNAYILILQLGLLSPSTNSMTALPGGEGGRHILISVYCPPSALDGRVVWATPCHSQGIAPDHAGFTSLRRTVTCITYTDLLIIRSIRVLTSPHPRSRKLSR